MKERIKKDSLHFAKALILGRKLLCTILALLPFLYLLHIVSEYSVDVPYWDDWAFIPLLEKSYQGTLTVHDLLVPHNEHRLFFPQIIMLTLAHLTGWNSHYEITLNIVLAAGIFMMLVYQMKITEKNSRSQTTDWLIPVVALIVFSLSQWQNWTWGWQVQIFLNVFSVVAGVVLLAKSVFRWWRFMAAVFLGIVAFYSFSNGLIYWPICFFILLFSNNWNRKTKWLITSLWFIIGFIVIYSYFYDYPDQAHRIRQWKSFYEQPLGHIAFVLEYLGAPIIGSEPSSVLERKAALKIGLIFLVAAIVLIFLLVSYCRLKFKLIAPWVALSFYSIGSALMTSVGRFNLGSGYSTSSRYVTISSLFWVANIVFLYLFVKYSPMIFKSKIKVIISRCAGLLIIVGIAIMVSLNSIDGAKIVKIRYYGLRRARNELISMKNDKYLKILGPGVPIRGVKILKKRHLSVFRER